MSTRTFCAVLAAGLFAAASASAQAQQPAASTTNATSPPPAAGIADSASSAYIQIGRAHV